MMKQKDKPHFYPNW